MRAKRSVRIWYKVRWRHWDGEAAETREGNKRENTKNQLRGLRESMVEDHRGSGDKVRTEGDVRKRDTYSMNEGI